MLTKILLRNCKNNAKLTLHYNFITFIFNISGQKDNAHRTSLQFMNASIKQEAILFLTIFVFFFIYKEENQVLFRCSFYNLSLFEVGTTSKTFGYTHWLLVLWNKWIFFFCLTTECIWLYIRERRLGFKKGLYRFFSQYTNLLWLNVYICSLKSVNLF